MNQFAEDILQHYGMPRRSGRYPWGSGENPRQRMMDFASRVRELRKQGVSDQEIAKAFGLKSTGELRTRYSNARDLEGIDRYESARALIDDGLSQNEAAKAMGVNESTLRSYLNERSLARRAEAANVANWLRDQIDNHGMIDVGASVERELGISREKMNQVLTILEDEGYSMLGRRVEQATNPGKFTTLKVIAPPGTEARELFDNLGDIKSIEDFKVRVDVDGNDRVDPGFVYPASMDSSRIQVRYAEDGGSLKDGVVELRRGVDDISLGESRYAQVRILVDGDRYIKGMAVYSDDLPPGVDAMFNTNKSKDVPLRDVLKKISSDPDNPFGSLIKENGGQSYYYDENGNKQLSLINKRADESDWGSWSDALPSQFLGKQSHHMIKQQLNMSLEDKRAELNDILSLTNPTVKKELLQSFADDCDAASVHLKAAALPRQKYQVILPVNSLKDNEVYAPNYNPGETLALVRFPHGGTFEIPILKVNNKNPEAIKMLGKDPSDVIGINAKVAARLSGADFDGDTVMVIPANSPFTTTKVTSTPPLKALEGFDHRMEYPTRPGMKIMRNTQVEMGKISNLITDMTLKGAKPDELARAVKHSMVVIDAEKHKLDYKKSFEMNGIAALRKKYLGRIDEDGKYREGASTLLSRAKSQIDVNRRQGSPQINQKGKEWYDPSKPEGALLWKESGEEYRVKKVNKRGEETTITKFRKQRSTQMAETSDARTLISDMRTPQEKAYADYANKLKAMANEARKAMVYSGKIKYSATAKAAYKNEVDSLMAQLNLARKNDPRERRAQILANSVVKAKKDANPELTKSDLRKIGQQALTSARSKLGAKRYPISISNKEWSAIQAGAISENVLKSILRNADIDQVRKLATPRSGRKLSAGKVARIKAMKARGYSNADIARAVGVSATSVDTYAEEGGGV